MTATVVDLAARREQRPTRHRTIGDVTGHIDYTASGPVLVLTDKSGTFRLPLHDHASIVRLSELVCAVAAHHSPVEVSDWQQIGDLAEHPPVQRRRPHRRAVAR